MLDTEYLQYFAESLIHLLTYLPILCMVIQTEADNVLLSHRFLFHVIFSLLPLSFLCGFHTAYIAFFRLLRLRIYAKILF